MSTRRLIDSIRDDIYELKDRHNGYSESVTSRASSLDKAFERLLIEMGESKKLKTSELKVRPFQSMKEPFAVLKFGNIEIELEYTMIRHIRLDWNSPRIASLFSSLMDEIAMEMEYEMNGKLPHAHRDGDVANIFILKYNHMYRLNPSMGEILDCEFTERYPDKRKHIDECPYGAGVRNSETKN